MKTINNTYYKKYINDIFDKYHQFETNNIELFKILLYYETIINSIVNYIFIPETIIKFKSNEIKKLQNEIKEFINITDFITDENDYLNIILKEATRREEYEICQNITLFLKHKKYTK